MCSSARSCSDLNIFLRRSDVRVSILCVRQGIGFRGIDRPSGGANARAGASASGIAPVFSMRLETVLTLILPLRLWASHGVHLSSLTQNSRPGRTLFKRRLRAMVWQSSFRHQSYVETGSLCCELHVKTLKHSLLLR